MYISSELEQILNCGFEIFPCFASGENAKSPIPSTGFKSASKSRDLIEAWFKTHIGCAWGMRTYETIGVLDVDNKHGKVGDASLAKLLEEYGNIHETPTVQTGSGGWHYWFRFPEGTKSRNGFLPDLDCKADGGYVIAPPSRLQADYHTDAYRWVEGKAIWEIPVAVAPDWLVALIREGKGQPTKQRGKATGETTGEARMIQEAREDRNPWEDWVANDLTGEGIEVGRQTVELMRRVGIHLARGEEPESVMALAEEWAGRCKPPMDEYWRSRTEAVIRSELRKRKSWSNGEAVEG